MSKLEKIGSRAEKLKSILEKNLAPERAGKLLEKYEEFSSLRSDLSDEISGGLGDLIELDDVNSVDHILDSLLSGKLERSETVELIGELEKLLIEPSEEQKTITPISLKTGLKQAPGFAKLMEKTPDAIEALDKMTISQKLALFKKLMEGMESSEVPEKKILRMAQADIVRLALESRLSNLVEHKTAWQKAKGSMQEMGTLVSKLWSDEDEPEAGGEEAKRIRELIKGLDGIEEKIMDSDKTLDELLDPEVAELILSNKLLDEGFITATKNPETGFAIFHISEPKDSEVLMKNYLAALAYICDEERGYDVAQVLLEDVLLKKEFENARDMYFAENPKFPEDSLAKYHGMVLELQRMEDKRSLGSSVNHAEFVKLKDEIGRFHYKPGKDQPAWSGVEKPGLSDALKRFDEKKKIEKEVRQGIMEATRKPEVIAHWTKEGMDKKAQEAYREQLVETNAVRAMNKHVAIASGNTLYSSLKGPKADFMKRYKRIMDTGEWYEMSAKRFDQITDELIWNAPLIIASGGVAAAARGVLSRAAMAIVRSGGLGRGLTVTRGAVALAEGAGLGSRTLLLGGRAAALLAEGAVFEITHTGLQSPTQVAELVEQLYGKVFDTPEDKQYLRDLPAWGKRILWTSATLGAFKLSGRFGESFSNKLLAGSKLLPKGSVREVISKLIIKGNIEVATMMFMGALQHAEANDWTMKDYHALDELLHAFIAVGALKIVGGVPKVVKWKGKRPEPKKSEVKPEKPAERVSLETAMEKGGEVGVNSAKKLMESLDALEGKGYEIKLNEKGEAVASKKGKPDIHLKESGELARESARASKAIERAIENPTPENLSMLWSTLSKTGMPVRTIATIIGFVSMMPGRAYAFDFANIKTAWGAQATILEWIILGVIATAPILVSFAGFKSFRGKRARGFRDTARKQARKLSQSELQELNKQKVEDAIDDILSDLDALDSRVPKDQKTKLNRAKAKAEAIPKAYRKYLLENSNDIKAKEKAKVEFEDAVNDLVRSIGKLGLNWWGEHARLPDRGSRAGTPINTPNIGSLMPGRRTWIALAVLAAICGVGLGGYEAVRDKNLDIAENLGLTRTNDKTEYRKDLENKIFVTGEGMISVKEEINENTTVYTSNEGIKYECDLKTHQCKRCNQD